MAIREATVDDLAEIVQLIKELAIYERAEDQAKATVDGLASALFCEHPKVFCLIAESDAGEVAGLALYFYNFSTWEGVHGLYLEDLFVRPQFRGQGLGGALLHRLAKITTDNGFARMEWVVLNWNSSAIAVYDRIGGEPLNEWTTYRLTGQALADYAAG